jgi:hypothetical protein
VIGEDRKEERKARKARKRRKLLSSKKKEKHLPMTSERLMTIIRAQEVIQKSNHPKTKKNPTQQSTEEGMDKLKQRTMQTSRKANKRKNS